MSEIRQSFFFIFRIPQIIFKIQTIQLPGRGRFATIEREKAQMEAARFRTY